MRRLERGRTRLSEGPQHDAHEHQHDAAEGHGRHDDIAHDALDGARLSLEEARDQREAGTAYPNHRHQRAQDGDRVQDDVRPLEGQSGT